MYAYNSARKVNRFFFRWLLIKSCTFGLSWPTSCSHWSNRTRNDYHYNFFFTLYNIVRHEIYPRLNKFIWQSNLYLNTSPNGKQFHRFHSFKAMHFHCTSTRIRDVHIAVFICTHLHLKVYYYKQQLTAVVLGALLAEVLAKSYENNCLYYLPLESIGHCHFLWRLRALNDRSYRHRAT